MLNALEWTQTATLNLLLAFVPNAVGSPATTPYLPSHTDILHLIANWPRHKPALVPYWPRTRAHNHFDGLVQERRNSIANALELRLSWTNPSIYNIPPRMNYYL